MTTDPSSSVTQARKELGARLRQLRRAAGLTGQQLALATGQHFTRISRIENGVQAPTERNIRQWCVACHAEDQTADLIATALSVESSRPRRTSDGYSTSGTPSSTPRLTPTPPSR